MTNLEMVDKVREKANVSYEEARKALDDNNWDVLDAIVDLERQGKIRNNAGGYSTSDSTAKGYTYRQVEPTASGGRSENPGKFQFFLDEMKKLLDKGISNSFVVRKNDKEVFSIPVLAFVLFLIFAFWVTVPLLIVGLVFHFRYGFRGAELGKDLINNSMDKAADFVDDLVEKYKDGKHDKVQ